MLDVRVPSIRDKALTCKSCGFFNQVEIARWNSVDPLTEKMSDILLILLYS